MTSSRESLVTSVLLAARVSSYFDMYLLSSIENKNYYQVAVLALILSPRTVPNVSMYGPDYHFQDQLLDIEKCYLIFCILWSVLVDQSGGLRMEIGVLYLSHALLVLAELIVCSTRGFA